MKYSHLSEEERSIIHECLDQRKSFKQIGKELGRDCTTISKEVRSRRIFKKTGGFGSKFNDCRQRVGCTVSGLCNTPTCREKLCKRCVKIPCYLKCGFYIQELCEKREKPPGVCNGCKVRSKCTLEKAFYSARSAQEDYRYVLSESRSGICADEDEIRRLDSYISPLIKNGQSIHHILVNSKANVMHSEKTIYKYVDLGLLAARNIDLRRKVRFKPRKSKHESLKVDKACYIGRTYEDYQKYIHDNPRVHTVEMDTVHGRTGGKCLLTLHFVNASFMLAYILDACTAEAVKCAFVHIRGTLGTELYIKLFPLLLGDRGSEFSDPKSIAFDEDGEGVSRVYYCDPQQSQQKGALENNHKFIRCIIPKGTSMDDFIQSDISLMMDHINSYGRPELKDRTPYHMFEFLYGKDGKEAIKKLGVNLIPPNKIILRPGLLK